MSDLERFARFQLEQGGIWYRLEKCAAGGLYKTQKRYCDGRNDWYETAVYQVFDQDGRRVLATTNYIEAYNKYAKKRG